MDWIGPVAVLALVDSTSFGTLLIPLWLMLSPRMRPGRLLIYLATVTVAYFLLGAAILAGAVVAADSIVAGLESRTGVYLRIVVGVVLLILGLTIEPWTKAGKARRAAAREQRIAERGPTRWQRWRTRIDEGETAAGALIGLALVAVAIEAASMIPYLAAMGILATADLSAPVLVVVLAGYCLLMITPALVLLGLRMVLHDKVAGILGRIEGWMTRSSREAVAWVLFLLGLWILRGALAAL